MNSKQLTSIISTAVPLALENIDTDQIIPARFLKSTERQGFGANLFRDWRYSSEGIPNPHFVLNQSRHSGKILIAGKNFGCGSSREHAAWALKDYGFDVIVSSFFADIFRNNALNNFLLPLEVTEDRLQQLLQIVTLQPGTLIQVDIDAQSLYVEEKQLSFHFPIHNYKKKCLLNGYDDIDYLLSIKQEIELFETRRLIQP